MDVRLDFFVSAESVFLACGPFLGAMMEDVEAIKQHKQKTTMRPRRGLCVFFPAADNSLTFYPSNPLTQTCKSIYHMTKKVALIGSTKT